MAEKLQEYSLTWEVTDEMTAKRIGSAGTGEIVSGGRTDDGRSGDSLPPSGADAGGNEGNSDCKTPQH